MARPPPLVRDTTEEAWADAEAKVAKMAEGNAVDNRGPRRFKAVGQQRLLELADRGDVLDDNLYTAPGKYGGAPGDRFGPWRARLVRRSRSTWRGGSR